MDYYPDYPGSYQEKVSRHHWVNHSFGRCWYSSSSSYHSYDDYRTTRYGWCGYGSWVKHHARTEEGRPWLCGHYVVMPPRRKRTQEPYHPSRRDTARLVPCPRHDWPHFWVALLLLLLSWMYVTRMVVVMVFLLLRTMTTIDERHFHNFLAR